MGDLTRQLQDLDDRVTAARERRSEARAAARPGPRAERLEQVVGKLSNPWKGQGKYGRITAQDLADPAKREEVRRLGRGVAQRLLHEPDLVLLPQDPQRPRHPLHRAGRRADGRRVRAAGRAVRPRRVRPRAHRRPRARARRGRPGRVPRGSRSRGRGGGPGGHPGVSPVPNTADPDSAANRAAERDRRRRRQPASATRGEVARSRDRLPNAADPDHPANRSARRARGEDE